MTSKRVRVHPLMWGTGGRRKEEHTDILYSQAKIKFSKILTAGDSFVVICFSEDDVDNMTNDKTVKLHTNKLEVIIPPHSKPNK